MNFADKGYCFAQNNVPVIFLFTMEKIQDSIMSKRFARPIRVILMLFGILIISMGIFDLAYPGLAYSEVSNIPPFKKRIAIFLGELLFALVLLYPAGVPWNIWGVLIRLAATAYGVFLLVTGGIEGIFAFFKGGKDPLIIPFSILMILVGILIPTYIIAFRQIRTVTKLDPGLETIGYDVASRFRDGKITKEAAIKEIERAFPGFSKQIYRNVLAKGLQHSRL